MDKPKMLSGYELVARGTTKPNSSLPEIGLKDVVPIGSWLEQKQIQSALEARKRLIEVERIEKCGTLSKAEWREELMLAEVTQKVGGHWQFVGHNVGKQLFLKPEEALFLIEVNCLQLKYNEVTVSLQQAYSLLLCGNITIDQYKVYASLSRLGYKVFRHEDNGPTEYERKMNLSPTKKVMKRDDVIKVENEKYGKGNEDNEISHTMEVEIDKTIAEKDCDTNTTCVSSPKALSEDVNNTGDNMVKMDITETVCENVEITISDAKIKILDDTIISKSDSNHYLSNEKNTEFNTDSMETNSEFLNETITKKKNSCLDQIVNPEISQNNLTNDNNTGTNVVKIEEVVTENKQVKRSTNEDTNDKFSNPEDCQSSNRVDKNNSFSSVKYQSKLHMLESRTVKQCDIRYVENIPDLFQKHVVTVKIPEEQYIPKNVFLNKTSYELNIENIRTKNVRPPSIEARTYNISEEVNGAHVRRVRDSVITPQSSPNNWNQQNSTNNLNSINLNSRFMRPSPQFRPFNFWRPRSNMNFFHFNMQFFNRPFPPMSFVPRFHLFPRPPLLQFPPFMNTNSNSNNGNVPNNSRKRTQNNAKQIHLEAIKRLAIRLKQLVQSGITQSHNIQSLERLMHTYNTRYKTHLRLTDDFEIIDDEIIVETIELEDDEEPIVKKRRTDTVNDKYSENLNRLKQLAMKLKSLETNNKASARHRRAFSSVFKRFNKSYGADIYLNSHYDVLDRKHINLDTSSESDCVVDETPVTPKRKKLRNPFNILKRLSETANASIPLPNTSKDSNSSANETVNVEDNSYSEVIKRTFNKNWLPDEKDFGRAEVPPRNLMYNYLIDSRRDDYIYDFIKNQPLEFQNWLDIKISFLRSIEESATYLSETIHDSDNSSDLRCLIEPGDFTDKHSILKKLSIIQTNEEFESETSLKIDFDVYNRDVQNFRKSNRPKPHFRIICINESTRIPCGSDIAALHSKYKDDVAVIFAIVGAGSISYLQMKPTNLPVYISSNDPTFE